MVASADLLATVLAVAQNNAKGSWEYGTVAEALLEWNNASISVWNDPFPNQQVPGVEWESVAALSWLRDKGVIRTDGETLYEDGAKGDPASLGIPALLIGTTDSTYHDAATRQKDHLIADNDRWSNGAISHREGYAELWADFIYMVPPFLAYYGVASDDVNLAKEGANQVKLYREVLGTEAGTWKHIVGPGAPDDGIWSTGNAWAAAGASRVLATLRKSKFDGETKSEQGELVGTIKAIIDGAIAQDNDQSELLRNYLPDSSWWGEISGTALLAATALRMAKLEPGTFGESYKEWALKKMDVVDSHIEEGTGIAKPAIDPLNWRNTEPYVAGSPEGQSFIILLHAAARDA
ncbi:hypothetical protein CC78DRAFT_37195 [Lojkania enalia]|uniref:Six-hairpin glycosidase n=1 Tax=Lojkania enalia TaxID=147567 RepID=A0A9P4K104_9PLEO|nr:hypothetical protein CC78DRAFT_37195 [Didymosphaeria enalia]